MNRDILWEGLVDDQRTRIRALTQDDCLVEVEDFNDNSELTGTWIPSDDEHASQAYMDASLVGAKRLIGNVQD